MPVPHGAPIVRPARFHRAMPTRPRRVRWTAHASAKADLLGVPRSDVEDAIIGHYQKRTRNPGAAEWRVRSGRFVIAFEHPDRGDETTAHPVEDVMPESTL
ncbi:MAG: hypothetical protein ACRDK5_09995 [Solirubrobacterales bacterium]